MTDAGDVTKRATMEPQRTQLRTAVFISPVVVLLLVLYWPTFMRLWRFWETDDNFGHGFLVPLVSVFLAWRARERLRKIPVQPYVPPIWLLAGALLVHVVGFRGAVLSASAVSFVLVVTWLVLFFFGKPIAREIGFALFFLVFMIPIPYIDQLSFPLKALATRVAAPAIGLLGIPVYREGALIFVPGFTMEIATVCSGLKSLVLITAVGTFYSYLTLAALRERIALVVSCIPIALVANIGRIVIIALLSLKISGERLFHLVHDYSGLPVYVIAGALLVLTGRLIEWLFQERHTALYLGHSPSQRV